LLTLWISTWTLRALPYSASAVSGCCSLCADACSNIPHALAGRASDATWTSHVYHHPTHRRRTPDVDGVAALDSDPRRPGTTRQNYFVVSRWRTALPHRYRSGDQSALCV